MTGTRRSELSVRTPWARALALTLAGLTALAGLAACGSGPRPAPPAAGKTRPAGQHAELRRMLARHADTAYVVDGAGVLPVNFATGRTGRLITIPGIRAAAIAISPDGHTAYVSTPHSVVPVYLAAGQAGPPISVPGGPAAIAVAPNGRIIYVLASRGVVPVDLASRQVGRPISTAGFQGTGITVAPGGLTAYVTGSSADHDFGVLPINLVSGVAGQLISLTGRPGNIVIAPNGQTAYLAAGDSVVPVNLMTDQPGLAIAVHASAGSIAIAPDGRTAYLAGLRNPDAGVLIPVDLGSGTAGIGIDLPGAQAGVSGLAITADGRTAVLTTPTSVIRVNLASGRAAPPIRIAAGASAVALGP